MSFLDEDEISDYQKYLLAQPKYLSRAQAALELIYTAGMAATIWPKPKQPYLNDMVTALEESMAQ